MSSDSQYQNPQQQQDVEDDTALQSSSSLTLIGQLINENYLNEGASDNNKNVDMVHDSSPPLSTSIIVDNTAELNTSHPNNNMIMDEMNDKNTKNNNNNNNNSNNNNNESDDELTNEDESFVHVTYDYCQSGQPSASSTVGGGSANDENDFSFEMEQALATPLSISTISTISDDTMIESNDNNLMAVEASTTTTTDEQQEQEQQQQQQVPTTMAISTTASLSLSSSWNTIDTTTTTTSPVFTEWEFDFDRDELAALQEQATTPRLETQTQQEEEEAEASEEEEGDSFRPISSDETDKGEESEEAYEKLIESSVVQINEPEQRSLSSDTAVHHEDHVHSLTTIVESKQQQQEEEEEEKMTRNLHWSTILIPNNPRFNIYANTAVVTALSLFLFTLHSACCSSTQ